MLKWNAALAVVIISLALGSDAFAQQAECIFLRAEGSNLLQQCGKKIHSLRLSLPDFKFAAGALAHRWFSYSCTFEPTCGNEPTISGAFVAPERWQGSVKDERAIYEELALVPLHPLPDPVPMPPVSCPSFDVSVGDMAGRAACFEDAETKAVIVVAADDRMGILLTFTQRDQSTDALRNRVIEVLSRFRIDRATGDAGLMEWVR